MAYTGSQTDICNYALVTELGNTPITSINDQNTAARALKAVYDTVRQSELRKRFWKFALRRIQIASVTPPATVFPSGIPAPYAYCYQMPTNLLRLVDFAGMRQSLGGINYRTGLEKFYDWQGNYLLTNLGTGLIQGSTSSPPPAGPQWIHYVQDITDTTQYDPNFAVSFACALADAVCKPVTGSTNQKAAVKADYQDAIREAEAMNAVERLPEGFADDSWTLSRL